MPGATARSRTKSIRDQKRRIRTDKYNRLDFHPAGGNGVVRSFVLYDQGVGFWFPFWTNEFSFYLLAS